MNATLFKEVKYSLSGLIDGIAMGDIGLPEIQRPFIWPNTKVRDLFDSMYRGFPVGYLLFWANGIGGGHKQIGIDPKQKIPTLLIVDGQQRLTSLFTVFMGIPVIRDNFQKERIFIAFNPLQESFAVTDAAIRKNPEFIPDIHEIWSNEVGLFELVDQYLSRLKATREVTNDEEKSIKKAINNLDNIQHYPFSALEISSLANEEQVAEIFVRVNSKGTTLNQADFILTLMSVFWDEGRTILEQFCRDARSPSVSEASPFNYFIQPDPDELLRVIVGVGFRRARLHHVYSILRGKDLDSGEFSDDLREKQFSLLKSAQDKVLNIQNWHDFLFAIRQAGYTSRHMITSQNAILYSYVFYLIGHLDYDVDKFELRKIIARWFFMTALTSRYSGSFESMMEQDLARLRDVHSRDDFVKLLDNLINTTFTDDYWSINLPNELATSSPRSPSLYAYYASLKLLHAKALFSKMDISELLDPSIKSKKSTVERHHLFPKNYLSFLGIHEIRDTNQIANYALLEWDDNIAIRDTPPAEYYPKYSARLSQEELSEMCYWHALPLNWERMEYPLFLEARRKLLAQVIRDGYSKL